MVKKKKHTKVIVSIVLLLIVAVSAFFIIKNYGGDEGLQLFAVGDQCNVAGSGTTDNLFTCNSNNGCDVMGWNQCDTKAQDTARVVVRAKNALYGTSGHWVALIGQYDQLESYVRSGSVSTSTLYSGQDVIDLPFGFKGFISTSSVYRDSGLFVAQNPGANLATNNQWYRYSPGQGANTNPEPIDNCAGSEICSGTLSAYVCESPWTIKSSSGAIKESGTASYNSKNAGQYQTALKRISNGDSFNFPGKINYAVIDVSNACIVSTCNSLKTGYTKCEQVSGCYVKTDPVSCLSGEVCQDTPSGAKCVNPIDFIYASPVDQEGNERSGFAVGEDIYFEYQINSESASGATATVELRDLSNNLISSQIQQFTFPNTQSSVVNFPGRDSTGTYKIIVKVTYNSGLTIEPREYEFRVADTIAMEIVGSSDGAVKTIYTNAPAIVEIKVFGEDGKFTSADTTLTAVLIEGLKKTPLTPYDTDFKNGVYDYYFNLPPVQVDAILQVTGTAQKLGFKTSQSKDLVVKPANLVVDFSNIALLQDLDTGVTKTITIDIQSPQLNPINADTVVVTATLPGGREDSNPIIVRNTGTGKYAFDYPFGDVSGAYFFTVRAEKAGFISKPLTSSAINVAPGGGTGLECVENKDCSTGEICTNNVCVVDNVGGSPTVRYIIYTIIALAIGFIIWLIIRLARRPRSQTSPGLTGLDNL